ncbi:hypothetical protein BGZ81_001309 [Podila clonocystis]|nr:hypothetical protein BGZ81_001309 [Podila clonocystis]
MTHASLPPELLLAVAEYLAPEEALAPSLACRSWHNVFARVLWRSYTIQTHKKSPTIDARTENAHHVKELRYLGTQSHTEDDLEDNIESYLVDDFVVPYTRLQRLLFCTTYNDSANHRQLWSHLAQLIMRNHELQELVISDPLASAPIEVWQAAISLPTLRTLEIRDVCMEMRHWEAIWNGCKGLRALRMYNVHAWGGLTINDKAMEKHAELESITLQDAHFLPLLKHCPNLRRVSWENGANSTHFLKMLLSCLGNGLLGQLEGLHTKRAKDILLASALKAMNRIKEVSVDNGHIENPTTRVLRQHFATLQILSIPTHIKKAGTFIPTVLASCPSLTVIAAPMMTSEDIINGGPWVCTQLKVFKIKIEIVDKEADAIRVQSREVLRRLSRLTHLTHLGIGDSNAPSPAFQGLDMRLESGLAQLSTLQCLQELNFDNTNQNMSEADVAWIKITWKRIRLGT